MNPARPTATAIDGMRYSLVAVWLLTALVSGLDWNGAGSRLLAQGAITDPQWVQWLIWSGTAADGGIGLLLWLRPGRISYTLAFAMMLLMTAIATWLLPSLWLEPLGPLTKNLPIAAALWFLLQQEAHA